MFKTARVSFLDTLRWVLRDVKWFLAFLLLTMWGFACAFHVLYHRDHRFEVHPALMIISSPQLPQGWSKH